MAGVVPFLLVSHHENLPSSFKDVIVAGSACFCFVLWEDCPVLGKVMKRVAVTPEKLFAKGFRG